SSTNVPLVVRYNFTSPSLSQRPSGGWRPRRLAPERGIGQVHARGLPGFGDPRELERAWHEPARQHRQPGISRSGGFSTCVIAIIAWAARAGSPGCCPSRASALSRVFPPVAAYASI